MATEGEVRTPRMWTCSCKIGDTQVWDRINPTKDPQLRQRQFRFGAEATTRITTLVLDEKDIKEDQYEGGFTVWHGSLHAISYMVNLKEPEFEKLKRKRVIDIGCGNGVLGIFALRFLDATEVFFQDLNDEVLQCSTRQNLMLNNIDPSTKINMLPGNWSTCFNSIPRNTFGLILTSDTVYRMKNYDTLHSAFDYLLDHDPESQILVGGKTHYFGNDGGILAFMEFVKRKSVFLARVLDKDDLGVPHTLISLTRVQVKN